MSEKTLTRMDLSEAVFREVGLSRNESADLVESVLQHMSDALVREVDVPGSYVLITSLYALSYISGALCFAALLFDRRDVA